MNAGSKLLRLATIARLSTSTSAVGGLRIAAAARRTKDISATAAARWIHSSKSLCSIPSPVKEGSEKPLSYHCEVGKEPLVNWTFGRCINRAAAEAPDKLAYIFVEESKRFTFAEFHHAVEKCATGLLGMGLKKGDSFMIFCPNTANWWILFAACAKIGVLTASVHPGYSKQEFLNALDKVKVKAIFIPEKFKTLHFYENLCKWMPELAKSAPGQLSSARYPELRTVIVDSDHALPGTVNVNDVLAGDQVDLEAAESDTSCDDSLTVIFTSGTTGAAKAACLTHHSFINNMLLTNNTLHTTERSNLKVVSSLPFFHVFGLMNASIPLVSHGMTVFPSIGYDQVMLMKAIQEYGCTEMLGSPTMYVDLLNHPERPKYDLSSLKRCIMGGSICTTEMRRMVEEGFGGVVALAGYGATEVSTVATVLRESDPLEKRMHTVGKPLAHTEIKVANVNTGVEVPCGEAGEIWIRGFHLFRGYLGERNKTDEVLTSTRWYRTGDLGVMDADGFVSIVGRLKDLIIRGGENIHPIDIEVELDSHPAVAESHVVAVPDDRLGDEICAVVVLNDGHEISEEQLREHLKDKIAYYKMPKYFLFEYDVPKTAIGKAQKNKLRKIAVEKLGL
ncbi:acyl-CoA synthetase family member 2 [Tropilaelaps mercedesae]|uniref:Medium-chain acyl-CoA ligase ACSF2, mitochondrial n=1 Tax=Tropilaelaps mercedesae TaxID=418985 RepID=A0A1V9XBL9_9ACAR|nr:acyl-CoA synthetase family member 2 [Tropilaelaps mercedesae]